MKAEIAGSSISQLRTLYKDAISNPYVWVMRTRLSAGKVAQYIVRATHEK